MSNSKSVLAVALSATIVSALGLLFSNFSISQAGAFLQETSAPSIFPTETATPNPTLIPTEQLSIEGKVTRLVDDLNGNALVDPGDTVEITITYANSALAALQGVTIMDDYDQLFISQIKDVSSSGEVSEDFILWNVGTLEAGQQGSVTYQAVLGTNFPPKGPFDVINKIQLKSDGLSGVLESEIIINVRVPDFLVDKTSALLKDINGDGKPGPGDTLLYTLSISNDSSVRAQVIELTDDYTESLFETPSEITEDGDDDGQVIHWEFEALEGGEEISVQYQVVIRSGLQEGTITDASSVSISSFGTAPLVKQFSFSIEVPLPPTPQPEAGGGAGISSRVTDALQLSLAFLVGVLIAGGFFVSKLIVGGEGGKPERQKLGAKITAATLVVGAVLILALGGAIERSAAGTILGTIAGYLLGEIKNEGGKVNNEAEKGGKVKSEGGKGRKG